MDAFEDMNDESILDIVKGDNVSEQRKHKNEDPETFQPEIMVSEARKQPIVLLRFTEAKGGECEIKCITSLKLTVKNISPLTSKHAAMTDFFLTKY